MTWHHAITLLALCSASATASAINPSEDSGGSIAVIATSQEDGPVTLAAVQSIVWHALHERHGHTPFMHLGTTESAAPEMLSRGLTTLYQVDVQWDHQAVPVDQEMVIVAPAPTLRFIEFRMTSGALETHREWDAIGAVALYRDSSGQGNGYLSLPEVALQEAIAVGLGPVIAPAWGQRAADALTLPVVVMADEEYREFYGDNWQAETQRRIQRASALLRQAGLALETVSHQVWESPPSIDRLSDLLDDLSNQQWHPGAVLRIGFTQQTGLSSVRADIEELGHAFLPGRDVIIADQATAPGHLTEWDIAEEGIAIAHEVLHALGAPHVAHDHLLMSATKSTVVHVISHPTRELARAAAQARTAHWDGTVALNALSHASDRWITDLSLQVDYIINNLMMGPGLPEPGKLTPRRLTALTNVAISHYYIEQARAEPVNASQLRSMALEHTEAALELAPTPAQTDLLVDLLAATQATLNPTNDTQLATEPCPSGALGPLNSFAPACAD